MTSKTIRPSPVLLRSCAARLERIRESLSATLPDPEFRSLRQRRIQKLLDDLQFLRETMLLEVAEP